MWKRRKIEKKEGKGKERETGRKTNINLRCAKISQKKKNGERRVGLSSFRPRPETWKERKTAQLELGNVKNKEGKKVEISSPPASSCSLGPARTAAKKRTATGGAVHHHHRRGNQGGKKKKKKKRPAGPLRTPQVPGRGISSVTFDPW